MRTSIISILVLFLFLTAISQEENMIVPAYSIVGWDSVTGDLGVAVVSKFLSVGSIVPYAKAGVGAIVTQNIPNPEHGIYGLKMLEEGMNAQVVVEKLIQNESAYQRQLGIVDASGNVYAYTGSGCEQYAGHSFGKGYSVQGSRLANMTVIKAMAMTFEMTQGDLSERLLSALEAGERAGGDQIGKQSAALLVVRDKGGYGGINDRFIDIRVDDDSLPLVELRRIYNLWQEKFLFNARLRAIDEFNKNKKFIAADLEKKRLTESFNSQLKRKPDDPQLLNDIAWILATNEIDPLQAIELAKRAAKLSPERLDILNTLAECHYRLKHYDEAMAIGSELVKRDPSNDNYWKQLQKFREGKQRSGD